MQYHNNILTVPANFLISSEIVTESNYRKMAQRKKLQVVRRGCNGTPALIAFDSMPEDIKKAVIAIVGDPYKVVHTSLIEGYIEQSTEISDFFENYKLADGRNLPKKTRVEYYNNAIVLEAVGRLLSEKRAKRAVMGKRLKINWPELSEGIQELDRSRFPHSLPANGRRLEIKFKSYMKEGNESLISKKFSNKNAAKVDDDVKESMIAELLADPRNLDNAQVRSLYNFVADKMGWKQITTTAVGVWREKLDFETYAGRHGSSAFNNTKAMQHKRKAPTFPLYYWTLDGWTVELLYQQTANGQTTYWHRPTVVVVLDACGKYPIGYAVGTHETPELIQAALRNAAKHTAELFGTMHRTAQIQADRYAKSKMMPIYEGMAKHATPAQAHNSKAKIIEPYFNYLNKKFCQLMHNWAGFGIQSDKAHQPNDELLMKHKTAFPDFAGVCKQVDMIMERERAEKQAEYVAKYAQMPAENKLELTRENYLMLFGATTGQKNMLQGTGLTVTLEGFKRTFDCFDINFRRHASQKWTVKYDPEDMTQVLAVNEGETLRFMCEQKYVQPMALIEREINDSDELNRINEFNAQMKEEIAEYRGKTGETVRDLIRNNPELEMLEKFMITDKSGQHKNNRSKARMLNTAAELNAAATDAKVSDVTSKTITRAEYVAGKVDLSQYLGNN